jgi:hypothetical protein
MSFSSQSGDEAKVTMITVAVTPRILAHAAGSWSGSHGWPGTSGMGVRR